MLEKITRQPAALTDYYQNKADQGRRLTRSIFLAYFRCLILLFFLLLPTQGNKASAEPAPPKVPKHKIIAAVMEMPPYAIEEDDGSWSGITVDLWKEIAGIADLDYEFKKFDRKTIIEATKAGTIDLAILGLSITADREKHYDFSDPYLAAIEAVAVPSDHQPSLWRLLHSTLLNWNVLVFVFILFALAVFGASILWFLEHRGGSEHYSGKNTKAFGRSLFWSAMVMAGREFPKAVGWDTVAPVTFAGRLFAMIWMMFGIAFISIVTASMASVLTSRQLQGAIRDADDLRHVRVGTVAASVGEDYLKHAKIKCEHVYGTPEELLQALVDHQVDAGVYNRHILVYYVRKMFAGKITVLTFPLRQDFLAIPMRSNYAQKEKINQALMKVTESSKWQEIVGNYLGNDWVNSAPQR